MNIKLSILKDYNTLEEFLKKGLLLSKAQIKKSTLSKKFLSKKIRTKDEIELPSNLINKGLINPQYSGPEIDILFEDEKIIIFNKPNGIHGHALSYEQSDTILNFMRHKGLDFRLGLFDSNQERGLLYRLDKVTSGVLFYIKDSSLFEELRSSFNSVAKEKTYIALVEGHFKKEGTHSHFFSSKGSNAEKVVVSDNDLSGHAGELTVALCEYNESEDMSLVKVQLKTGLRHQIRAQLSFLGYPLVGDEFYGAKSSDRVFLHAYSYSIDSSELKKEMVCPKANLFDKFFDLNSSLKMLSK